MSVNAVLGSLEEAGKIGPARLVEMGKIKIGGLGAERTSSGGAKFRMPVKQDHFTIVSNMRDQKGDLIQSQQLMTSLIAKYADPDGKLRRIPIRLLSDDLDDVMQTAFVWYGGKTVAARSDGNTVIWFNDKTNGKRLQEPVEEPWDPKYLDLTVRNQPMFKVHTVFNCVIAAEEAHWGGVYKFRTTSLISLRQLHSSLVHLQTLTGGILVGMPLMLIVRPIQVSPNGTATTVHVVHVELRGPDLKQLQTEARERARFKIEFKEDMAKMERQYRALLTGPGTETGKDAEDVAEEFNPDDVIDATPAPASYALLDEPTDTATTASPTPPAEIPARPEADSPTTVPAVEAPKEKPATPPASVSKPTPAWVQTILKDIDAAVTAKKTSLLQPIGNDLIADYRNPDVSEPDKLEFYPSLFEAWVTAYVKIAPASDKPRFRAVVEGLVKHLPPALHQKLMALLG